MSINTGNINIDYNFVSYLDYVTRDDGKLTPTEYDAFIAAGGLDFGTIPKITQDELDAEAADSAADADAEAQRLAEAEAQRIADEEAEAERIRLFNLEQDRLSRLSDHYASSPMFIALPFTYSWTSSFSASCSASYSAMDSVMLNISSSSAPMPSFHQSSVDFSSLGA